MNQVIAPGVPPICPGAKKLVAEDCIWLGRELAANGAESTAVTDGSLTDHLATVLAALHLGSSTTADPRDGLPPEESPAAPQSNPVNPDQMKPRLNRATFWLYLMAKDC